MAVNKMYKYTGKCKTANPEYLCAVRIKRSLIVYYCMAFSVLLSCSSIKKNNYTQTFQNKIEIDTIKGYFLYEVNVPYACYTRFDQVEQGNSLILFDSLIAKKRIEELYNPGVYLIKYGRRMDPFIEKHGSGIAQNESILFKNFLKDISYSYHENDSVYNKGLLSDKNKILSYKKIYIELVCVNLGKLSQLIPVTDNYVCCYSNRNSEVSTYFITDVLKYDIY